MRVHQHEGRIDGDEEQHAGAEHDARAAHFVGPVTDYRREHHHDEAGQQGRDETAHGARPS